MYLPVKINNKKTNNNDISKLYTVYKEKNKERKIAICVMSHIWDPKYFGLFLCFCIPYGF